MSATTVKVYQWSAATRRRHGWDEAVLVSGFSPARNARAFYRGRRQEGVNKETARRAVFGSLICSGLFVTVAA